MADNADYAAALIFEAGVSLEAARILLRPVNKRYTLPGGEVKAGKPVQSLVDCVSREFGIDDFELERLFDFMVPKSFEDVPEREEIPAVASYNDVLNVEGLGQRKALIYLVRAKRKFLFNKKQMTSHKVVILRDFFVSNIEESDALTSETLTDFHNEYARLSGGNQFNFGKSLVYNGFSGRLAQFFTKKYALSGARLDEAILQEQEYANALYDLRSKKENYSTKLPELVRRFQGELKEKLDKGGVK